MLRWIGTGALMFALAGCATYPAMSEDEQAFQASCDQGDFAACADLAHSVAVDRSDTLYRAAN